MEILTIVVMLVEGDTQLAWPEAALPRYAAGHGRSVHAAACLAVSLPGERRPFRRNLALKHTRAKGYSAQAVKPEVCRCAEIEKKHISSTTVSFKRFLHFFDKMVF